jgi:hypothetical protein
MEDLRSRLLIGLLLVAGGILFLLQNFGLIPTDMPLLWMIVFGVAGLAFVFAFALGRREWWGWIPGLTLLGLAALLGIETLNVGPDELGAAVFMGSIALAFFVVYATTGGENWWAIIPAGVLTSIALVILLSDLVEGDTVGGLFLLGIGLTFGILYFVPTPEGRMKWAAYPAGILVLIGLLVFGAAANLINYIWPLALILGGLFLMLRALRS